jgi:6-phosphogluconolactonase/glucosamine-6-phosphate isomerase/deaminase
MIGGGKNFMKHEDSGLAEAFTLDNVSKRNGISVVFTEGENSGADVAKRLLYGITNLQTVLFLSGGKTPANLYFQLGHEQVLGIGAAAMVDERYGKPMHDYSNELMISRSGLPAYFKKKDIPFFCILEREENIVTTALRYNAKVEYLLEGFSKSVAILGIGEDGHIAGITPNRDDIINPLFSEERSRLLVSYFIDPAPLPIERNSAFFAFGERVTLTFKGLSKMDVLIVLAFGERKQAALSALFEKGTIEQLPARFLKNKNVASKTILITDRKI